VPPPESVSGTHSASGGLLPKQNSGIKIMLHEERHVHAWRFSEHKDPHQPPNQKKRDDCDDDVTDPLERRFGISEIEHVAIVASVRKTG
jgi:hypothetical protein